VSGPLAALPSPWSAPAKASTPPPALKKVAISAARALIASESGVWLVPLGVPLRSHPPQDASEAITIAL